MCGACIPPLSGGGNLSGKLWTSDFVFRFRVDELFLLMIWEKKVLGMAVTHTCMWLYNNNALFICIKICDSVNWSRLAWTPIYRWRNSNSNHYIDLLMVCDKYIGLEFKSPFLLSISSHLYLFPLIPHTPIDKNNNFKRYFLHHAQTDEFG